jgi:hypothetical protein
MGGAGADQQVIAAVADTAQLVQAADVDQELGVGEPRRRRRAR